MSDRDARFNSRVDAAVVERVHEARYVFAQIARTGGIIAERCDEPTGIAGGTLSVQIDCRVTFEPAFGSLGKSILT